MPLQAAARTLVVQNAAVEPPGQQKVICQDVNFTLAAGKALGRDRSDGVGQIVAGAHAGRRLVAGARQRPA